DVGDALWGVPLRLLVLMPEQRAEGLVLAPVAQGVLTCLELPGLDALGDDRDPAAELVDVGWRSDRRHPLAGGGRPGAGGGARRCRMAFGPSSSFGRGGGSTA